MSAVSTSGMNWSSQSDYETDSDDTLVASDLASLVRDVLLGAVMVACCLLTVVGNAMVLQAVRTDRKLQTVSNAFH